MAIVKKTGPTAKRFPFNINYNPELRYNWETGRFENDAAAYDPAPGAREELPGGRAPSRRRRDRKQTTR